MLFYIQYGTSVGVRLYVCLAVLIKLHVSKIVTSPCVASLAGNPVQQIGLSLPVIIIKQEESCQCTCACRDSTKNTAAAAAAAATPPSSPMQALILDTASTFHTKRNQDWDFSHAQLPAVI